MLFLVSYEMNIGIFYHFSTMSLKSFLMQGKDTYMINGQLVNTMVTHDLRT